MRKPKKEKAGSQAMSESEAQNLEPQQVVGNAVEGEADITAKINYLFETYRKPDGEKYSFADVAGSEMDATALYRLAKGERTNPGYKTLAVLNKFFGLAGDFWFLPLEEWEKKRSRDAQGEEVSNDPTMDMIVARARQLTPGQKVIIGQLVEEFYSSKSKNKGKE
jgi:hypothetical protein